MKSPRRTVFELLGRMEKDSAFSNILLDDALSKSELEPVEKKFAAALFYGVTERKLTLDAVIKKYSAKPADKLSAEVVEILRMGIYQLLYMDSVPDSAAVNESVKLSKENKNPAISGFVNAVLRSFIRDGKRLPERKGRIPALSLEYSAPEWLILKWINEYGEDRTMSMLEASLGRAPVTVKANTLKASLDEIISALETDGIAAQPSDIFPDCLEIKTGGAVENSTAYKCGYFHVQDISSQLCCMMLGAKEGETILDLCSAPGGKAFYIAEMMKNSGHVFAYDIRMKKVGLIAQGAKRLGLKNIKSRVNDAKIFSDEISLADKILCDVPCSGLGVIRRKPEIKYKNPDDFS
ncbi:MAG: 16S rRNA (cytosine(967)-C(5))-methyltransferase RsmB, partial [Oscillospiraceae bacterium]